MFTEAHTKSRRGHQDLFVHVAHHCSHRRASTKKGNTLEDSSDSTLTTQMNTSAIAAPNTFDFTSKYKLAYSFQYLHYYTNNCFSVTYYCP